MTIPSIPSYKPIRVPNVSVVLRMPNKGHILKPDPCHPNAVIDRRQTRPMNHILRSAGGGMPYPIGSVGILESPPPFHDREIQFDGAWRSYSCYFGLTGDGRPIIRGSDKSLLPYTLMMTLLDLGYFAPFQFVHEGKIEELLSALSAAHFTLRNFNYSGDEASFQSLLYYMSQNTRDHNRYLIYKPLAPSININSEERRIPTIRDQPTYFSPAEHWILFDNIDDKGNVTFRDCTVGASMTLSWSSFYLLMGTEGEIIHLNAPSGM